MQNDPLVEKVNDPTLNDILKYQNHPSILEMERKLKKQLLSYYFRKDIERDR